MPERLIDPWRPYDCDVTDTWGNGTVPITVASVFGRFLTFIWLRYLVFATIGSNNDRDRGKSAIPFMTHHVCNCTVSYILQIKIFIEKCSNSMSPCVVYPFSTNRFGHKVIMLLPWLAVTWDSLVGRTFPRDVNAYLTPGFPSRTPSTRNSAFSFPGRHEPIARKTRQCRRHAMKFKDSM